MAYTRFNGNVQAFAENSTLANRTVFGDTAQSNDIDDNLNTDYLLGWEIVGIDDAPTKQDFNAQGFTLGYLTSYLYQQGVATWNSEQEYITNSLVVASNGGLYRSKTGTVSSPNTNNNPENDTVNWELSSNTNIVVEW